MVDLKSMIGEMLIMGFNGQDLDQATELKEWLNYSSLGGVLLFDYDVKYQHWGKNLISAAQIKKLTADIQAYQHHIGPERSDLFIAIDYEGGHVDRLKKITGCPPTISPKSQSKLPAEDFLNTLNLMASTLKSLGFNLNFSPLVDLDFNQSQGIIGFLERSYGRDPFLVSAKAETFVQEFARHAIATCYKHFPGHGSAIDDSHLGFVDVSSTFHQDELIPYTKLVNLAQYPVMVMTAHVINRELDQSGLPATLSYPILTELLRNKLNYQGVIISDDLQMKAISDHYSLEDALCMTINAGSDMLIFANQIDDISAITVIDTLLALVQAEKISENKIRASYQRIIKMKKLLHQHNKAEPISLETL